MAIGATQIVLETPALDFKLPATDGRTYTFGGVAGKKGTVIVFICNHCPYVKAVIGGLAGDARVLMAEGIGFAAISANDAAEYPEDSFDNMIRFARAHDLPFPYLRDETQAVARAYGAVCTPDYFGYGQDHKLKYRGRLDEGRTEPPPVGARRESGRGHAEHRGNRRGTRESNPVRGLLDQMEGGVTLSCVKLQAPPPATAR